MSSTTPDVYVFAHPSSIEVFGSYRIAAAELYNRGYMHVESGATQPDKIANILRKSGATAFNAAPQKFVTNHNTPNQKVLLVQRCEVVRRPIVGIADCIPQPKLSDIDL